MKAKKYNFSLTELLIVMAIISILAGLLLPAFNRSRANALSTACGSNLKQVGSIFMLYANDFDDLFPAADFAGNVQTPLGTISNILTDTAHRPWYVELAKRKYFDKTLFDVPTDSTKTFVNCPATRGNPFRYNAYGVPVGTAGVEIGSTTMYHRIRADVDNRHVLAADSAIATVKGDDTYAIDEAVATEASLGGATDKSLALRHVDRINILMADGRVDNYDEPKVKRILKDYKYVVEPNK